MTTEPWRQRDPVDGDVDWRAIRADGSVAAGLVKLGRSTVVYTYDTRLAGLDGARFDSAEAARAAIAALLAQRATPPIAAAALAPVAPPTRAEVDGRGGPALHRNRQAPHRERRRPGAGFFDG